jgi:hypothetical protein
MVERRNKLVPIMLNERKNGKTAYIVGDKLFINGGHLTQHSLKHNTSYSFTILRKPESHNFRTKPFEIFHVHILITLFPLDSFSVKFSSHSAAS